uniref:Reverse transcriptase domain-containing protein n=1 Tax=Tanacetum cinerariifolium TaxID=118510 RepID=A0A699IT75_TANCI|nr:reverse transcriptase domain-containing protein [Tanacetum cinerariifolium]
MTAFVIPILSDLFEESVGSHVSWEQFLLPHLPKCLIWWIIHLDSDPLKDSLPSAPELPLVLPLLCFDDSEADSESKPAEQRLERHESLVVYDVMLSRWRDKVASRPSSRQRKLLTIRKRAGPFPARRLAWRRVSHHSSDCYSLLDFTSDSSSSGSTLDSLSGTFSGSPSDSLADTSSVHSSGSDASGQTHSRPSTRVASFSIEEHREIGTVNAEAVADLGIGNEVGVDTKDGIDMGVKIAASDIRGDAPDLEGTLYDIVHYMSKIPLERITGFETTQRQLEDGQLMASRERAGLTNRIKRLGQENLRVRALLCIERDRVDSFRHHMALSQEEFRQIHRDHDDAQSRLRRLESLDMIITRFGMTPEAIEELIAKRVAENHGNKLVILEGRWKAYAIGRGDANLGYNVLTGMFILNNHYDSVLFDSGADRSFVSTTFSTLLDIIPDTLDVSYVVELADRRIVKTNTMLRGCTIGLFGHPFNVDLMPIELDGFDVIIGDRSDKGKKLTLSHIVYEDSEVYEERLSSISGASYKEGNRS